MISVEIASRYSLERQRSGLLSSIFTWQCLCWNAVPRDPEEHGPMRRGTRRPRRRPETADGTHAQIRAEAKTGRRSMQPTTDRQVPRTEISHLENDSKRSHV